MEDNIRIKDKDLKIKISTLLKCCSGQEPKNGTYCCDCLLVNDNCEIHRVCYDKLVKEIRHDCAIEYLNRLKQKKRYIIYSGSFNETVYGAGVTIEDVDVLIKEC